MREVRQIEDRQAGHFEHRALIRNRAALAILMARRARKLQVGGRSALSQIGQLV